jgi:CubicO group peptidase (beta-lactamase class C family)
MADLLPAVDPGAAGFEEGRLARLDAHFRAYVDDGRLPGFQIAITRAARLAHFTSYGMADVEAARPVDAGTVWRIYSMTKPITSVAAMALWEDGAFELTDPISRWLPAFASPQVYTGGPAAKPVLRAAAEPIRIWHLLTHTAGLTYGFHRMHVTDEIYRAAGFDVAMPRGLDLAGIVDALAELPLAFDPGSEWLYSMATDVLGRLIEVVAGKPFAEVLTERVFEPLGMDETGFWVPPERADRLAALYALSPGAPAPVRFDLLGQASAKPPRWTGGGGGLLSTTADYQRFLAMLMRGGQLDGARVLAPRTVTMMLRNHLPGGADLESFGRRLYAETSNAGVGFGLGFATVLDPTPSFGAGSVGEAHWGGMASTNFWIDPAEDLAVTFMTQLMPSSSYPLRSQLRQLVYSALS